MLGSMFVNNSETDLVQTNIGKRVSFSVPDRVLVVPSPISFLYVFLRSKLTLPSRDYLVQMVSEFMT